MYLLIFAFLDIFAIFILYLHSHDLPTFHIITAHDFALS